MRTLLVSITATLALAAGAAHAQPPIGAPAGATAQCNDGTWSSSTIRTDACSAHQGIKAWYGTEKGHPETPAGAMMPPQTFPKPTPSTMPNAGTPTMGTQTGNRPTLPGGLSPTPVRSAGKVWVEPASKLYYCRGDREYGSTSNGEYMGEAEAVAKGNRSARGMTCPS